MRNLLVGFKNTKLIFLVVIICTVTLISRELMWSVQPVCWADTIQDVLQKCSLSIISEREYFSVLGWKLKLTDAITAFSTLFLVLTSCMQWSQTRRTVLEMQAGGKVAEENAKATKLAAETARASLLQTERAYISLSKLETVWILDPVTKRQRDLAIIPIWHNSGSTPPKNTSSKVNWWKTLHVNVDKLWFDDSWHNEDEYDRGRYYPLPVPPKGYLIGNTFTIPALNYFGAAERAERLFIWGWVEYDDIFSDTPRHRTEFCLELRVLGDPEVL